MAKGAKKQGKKLAKEAGKSYYKCYKCNSLRDEKLAQFALHLIVCQGKDIPEKKKQPRATGSKGGKH